MKKKLGDLTLKEAKMICKKQYNASNGCVNCLLFGLCQSSFDYPTDRQLNKEIEVEE